MHAAEVRMQPLDEYGERTVTDIHGPDAPVALRTRRRLDSGARNR